MSGVVNANWGLVVAASYLDYLSQDAWNVSMQRQTSGTSVSFTIWAVCANVGP